VCFATLWKFKTLYMSFEYIYISFQSCKAPFETPYMKKDCGNCMYVCMYVAMREQYRTHQSASLAFYCIRKMQCNVYENVTFLKMFIFRDITLYSPLKFNRHYAGTCHVCFLLGLFFDPEDIRDIFFRNVCWISTYYTEL
jgi:hypothetical protein